MDISDGFYDEVNDYSAGFSLPDKKVRHFVYTIKNSKLSLMTGFVLITPFICRIYNFNFQEIFFGIKNQNYHALLLFTEIQMVFSEEQKNNPIQAHRDVTCVCPGGRHAVHSHALPDCGRFPEAGDNG
nr:hypothetical protein [Pantoea stewartii]